MQVLVSYSSIMNDYFLNKTTSNGAIRMADGMLASPVLMIVPEYLFMAVNQDCTVNQRSLN